MKLIRSISLVLLCIAFVPSLAFGDPLTYLAEGSSVTITDCDESASGALVIPSSYNGKPVISIGSYAFKSCSSLTSVTIPDSVTSIGRFAFGYCSSLTNVTIPDSVTSIGQDAFWDCSSLTSVTIPDSVTSIGNMAFKNCSSLTSVIIGNNVTSIGRWAFKGCHNLTNVTIPDSVTRIGGWAFSGCSSLKSITFEGNAPSSFGADVFKYLPIGATITVPAGATGFGETYAGLPVQILKKTLKINSFSKSDSLFTVSFETKSDSTYTIEVTQDFKQWGEIGEVQGTGSSVKFTDPRLPIVPFKRNYFRVKLVD